MHLGTSNSLQTQQPVVKHNTKPSIAQAVPIPGEKIDTGIASTNHDQESKSSANETSGSTTKVKTDNSNDTQNDTSSSPSNAHDVQPTGPSSKNYQQQANASSQDGKSRQGSERPTEPAKERPVANDISKSKPSHSVPKHESITTTNNRNYVPTVQKPGARNHLPTTMGAETSQLGQNAPKNTRMEGSKSHPSTNDSHSPLLPGRLNGDEMVKLSSDEGIDIQSSLDLSKQSHEYSVPLTDQSKTSNDISSKATSSDGSPRSPLDRPTENSANEKSLKSSTNSMAIASSKSWADLFKRRNQNTDSVANGNGERDTSNSDMSDEENRNTKSMLETSDVTSRTKKISNAVKEHRSQEASIRALDKIAPRLAQKINSVNLKHSLPFLKPRGFINKGNGCYINSTLQALIACPPFYNLMKEIGDLKCFQRENSCTPILDSFAELFLNFPPVDPNKQKNKPSLPQDRKLSIDKLQAEAIEPKCIYNVLGHIKSECLKGKQK